MILVHSAGLRLAFVENGVFNGVLTGRLDATRQEPSIPILTAPIAEKLDRDAATLPTAEIAGYLQDQLGQRIAAHLVDLRDAKQIGRYRKADGPIPNQTTDLRLREGYKIVRMIVDAFDANTAKAWLFGTNTRLDDAAPVDVLRRAAEPTRFAEVRAAARQLVSFEG